MHSITKDEGPLDTFHVDHLGPMSSTNKNYRHILVIVDAFTKFTWLYPTKSTDSAEVVSRLKKQAAIFGNPRRIISDRGTAFTSHVFREFCEAERIQHTLIVTGVPRGNGQVERINRTLISVLTKLAIEKPEDWYKFVDLSQTCLNNTVSRSTGYSPFHLLIGVNMRTKDDHRIREMIEAETVELFQESRDELRNSARLCLARMQATNKKEYDRRRTKPRQYKEDDLVAIRRTQFKPGTKLYPKFLGPYRVKSVLRNDRYVEKVGEGEGPHETSTAVDSMKLWAYGFENDSEADD